MSPQAVAGYRSLRQLTLPLAGLTVVCGANGCGKSNLYRSLGLIAAAHLSYASELGYRANDQASAFVCDPEIKREWIWSGGPFHPLSLKLSPGESLCSAVSDPLEVPEAFRLRRTILNWRFYDSFRTDRDAPARGARIATRTLSLTGDSGDLAAVRECGLLRWSSTREPPCCPARPCWSGPPGAGRRSERTVFLIQIGA